MCVAITHPLYTHTHTDAARPVQAVVAQHKYKLRVLNPKP